MANDANADAGSGQREFYQIRIDGHLGGDWSDWFDGLAITLDENGETLLTGPVTDQAALHGLLRKVRDLGIPLVSVISAESVEELNHEDA